jgi:hypothetical protein
MGTASLLAKRYFGDKGVTGMVRFMVRSVILLGLLYSTALGQLSFDFTGSGARAKAMGGAYLGVSDDIYASTWNPAGLRFQEATQLGLEIGAFLPRGEATDLDASLNQSGSWQAVNYLGILAPIRIKGHPFVVSASYSKLFEDYIKLFETEEMTYQQDFFGNTLPNPEPFHFELEAESHFAPYSVNLAFGTPISDQISFGMSADVYVGKAVTEASEVDILENFPDPAGNDQTATGTRRLAIRDTSSFSGFGITGALKYDSDRFGVGFVVRAPLSFDVSTDNKIFTVFTSAGLPQAGISDTTFFDDQLVKYDLPIMLGLGLYTRITDALLWAGDIEYRGFSGRVIKVRTDRNLTQDTETFQEVDPQWEDVFVIRSGLEYTWETGSRYFPVVPIRAGFSLIPVPTPNQQALITPTQLGILFEKNDGYKITGGIGVQWAQIHVDLAWVYNNIDYQVVETIVDFDGNFALLPLESKNRTHDLVFTFTGYF